MAGKLHQNAFRLVDRSTTYEIVVCALMEGLEEHTNILCSRAAPGFLAEGLIGSFRLGIG